MRKRLPLLLSIQLSDVNDIDRVLKPRGSRVDNRVINTGKAHFLIHSEAELEMEVVYYEISVKFITLISEVYLLT